MSEVIMSISMNPELEEAKTSVEKELEVLRGKVRDIEITDMVVRVGSTLAGVPCIVVLQDLGTLARIMLVKKEDAGKVWEGNVMDSRRSDSETKFIQEAITHALRNTKYPVKWENRTNLAWQDKAKTF